MEGLSCWSLGQGSITRITERGRFTLGVHYDRATDLQPARKRGAMHAMARWRHKGCSLKVEVARDDMFADPLS